jgi:hypothetical protein
MNMNTDKYDLAVEFGGSPVPTNQSRNPRRWWSVITSLMALAVLMEAIFAGAMMSGVGWAREQRNRPHDGANVYTPRQNEIANQTLLDDYRDLARLAATPGDGRADHLSNGPPYRSTGGRGRHISSHTQLRQ